MTFELVAMVLAPLVLLVLALWAANALVKRRSGKGLAVRLRRTAIDTPEGHQWAKTKATLGFNERRKIKKTVMRGQQVNDPILKASSIEYARYFLIVLDEAREINQQNAWVFKAMLGCGTVAAAAGVLTRDWAYAVVQALLAFNGALLLYLTKSGKDRMRYQRKVQSFLDLNSDAKPDRS